MADVISLFPPSPRVFYEKAPLIEVVSQLRFPPILKIQDQPAEFQECVRADFPLLETMSAFQFPAAGQLPSQVLQLLGSQAGTALGYRFLSEDRTSVVTLMSDSLAYSTVKYTVWEEFREKLMMAVSALETSISHPSLVASDSAT